MVKGGGKSGDNRGLRAVGRACAGIIRETYTMGWSVITSFRQEIGSDFT